MINKRYLNRVAICKDRDTGECHIKAYDQNDRRWEEADGFESCLEDARGTAKDMVRRGHAMRDRWFAERLKGN